MSEWPLQFNCCLHEQPNRVKLVDWSILTLSLSFSFSLSQTTNNLVNDWPCKFPSTASSSLYFCFTMFRFACPFFVCEQLMYQFTKKEKFELDWRHGVWMRMWMRWGAATAAGLVSFTMKPKSVPIMFNGFNPHSHVSIHEHCDHNSRFKCCQFKLTVCLLLAAHVVWVHAQHACK